MNHCLILCLLLTLVATCVFAQLSGENQHLKIPPVDRVCLDCLCKISTGCDENLRCRHYGMDLYLCGPYHITWGYWHESGRPGDSGGDTDFETCLNNKACSEATIRGYMRKHGKDCDGNGKINCDDFIRIHKLGVHSCDDNAIRDTDFWKKYDTCYHGSQSDSYQSLFGEYDYGESDDI